MPVEVLTRASALRAQVTNIFGPLAELAGDWRGHGFNLISLPDFDPTLPSTGPKPSRLKLNATFETLEFTRIGGAVPNRGSEAIPPAVGGHAGGQEAFERGGRVARIALAQSQDAAEAAAGSSPKEPCREQDAQGHFVAAENYNQLPHEYNLSDDSTEPNKRQSRFNGWCRPLRMAHDDVLLRCLHRAKLEFSWLSKASTWEECAAIEESWRGRRIRLIHVYKRILILSELFTLFLDWL
jgi:hypothetical protein